VSHIDDLARRLQAHGSVVRLDIMPHLREDLRRPYAQSHQWPDHLPVPYSG
jgi:hypothetical protein